MLMRKSWLQILLMELMNFAGVMSNNPVADRVKSIISDNTNQYINSLQKIFDGQRYLIPMMDLWEIKSIREAVMQHQSACQAYNQSGRHPKIKDQGIEICINNDFCRGLLNKFNQKNPFTAYYVHLETSIAHSMRQIESIITHAIWPGSDPMGNGVTSLIMSFIRWDRYQLEDCHGPLAVIAALFDKEKGLGGADDTHGYLLAQSGNKVRAHCILDPSTIRQVTAALATDSKRARQEEPSSSSSSSSSCSSKRPIVDGR